MMRYGTEKSNSTHFIKDPSYVIVGDGEDAFASLTKFVEVR
jgi:hypothetical protein